MRPREAGAVRIEKDVVTEERRLEVPVTDERVRDERSASAPEERPQEEQPRA